MPPQVKQDGVAGTRPFKNFVLNHKQRYHYEGNFNFDSANVSQILGKPWVSSAPITVKKGLNLVEDDGQENLDQTQKITQLINSKPDLNLEQPKDKLGQTQYSRQNLVAQKVLEMARKKQQREKARYEEEMSQKQTQYNTKNTFFRSTDSRFDLTANYDHPQKTHSKKGEPLSKYNKNGRPTTNFIKGHTNWKITYPNLDEEDQNQEEQLQREFYEQTMADKKQSKFHPQNRKVQKNIFSKTEQNFNTQRNQINPFRMTTYDTTYGTPFKKYHYDEEEDSELENQYNSQKQEDFVSTNYQRLSKTAYGSRGNKTNYFQQKFDKIDKDQQKIKGLISYKGVVPKNMNMQFKWNHHIYERQNFMRKAPIWSNTNNNQQVITQDTPKDYRIKGYMSNAKLRKTIRTKDYI
ncbi:hypothetical protein PPERSA_07318 [Pseudocohnilembus persalinus]|uniref:Uncharacterized protein n=1 Tax=Pseudocohnilembus persalinus TaxID=266149 RepID=A0A0V0R6Y2_PSEPJ|nr:hypothetical protein PPERSA_07318 [Pseudocohnilembus persalinus]|eukprot:KRX10233.1 hypothetical protein PPERSA_07318 [Pseudocohnilembus persalinus]